jgi:hypothetical protein
MKLRPVVRATWRSSPVQLIPTYFAQAARGRTVLNRILPNKIDNVFRGHRLALWLFGLFVALKLVMGTNSALNARSVASGADGIPIDDLGSAGDYVVRLFALLGFGGFVLALLALLVLIRYRAMVPLLFLVFLVEMLGRRGLATFYPMPQPASGTSVGVYINLGLLLVLVLGLALSLLGRSEPGT